MMTLSAIGRDRGIGTFFADVLNWTCTEVNKVVSRAAGHRYADAVSVARSQREGLMGAILDSKVIMRISLVPIHTFRESCERPNNRY